MSKKCILLSGFGALLFFITACRGPEAQTTKDFQSKCWGIMDTVSLDFNNENPELTHLIKFPVSFTGEYKYNNLFIRFSLRAPSGKESAGSYQFKLMDANGDWLGSSSGSGASFNLKLGDPVRFTEKGKYQLRIWQFMREDLLCGITEAGIEIRSAE